MSEQEQGLEMLRDHWRRHVFQRVMSTWMDKDKQAYTQVQCREINDLLTASYHLLENLTIHSSIEFVTFLQNMDEICRLMSLV